MENYEGKFYLWTEIGGIASQKWISIQNSKWSTSEEQQGTIKIQGTKLLFCVPVDFETGERKETEMFRATAYGDYMKVYRYGSELLYRK